MKREVARLSDPDRARILQRFFQTGSGGYGEGDRFAGLTVPTQRRIAGGFRQLPLEECSKLLRSPIHEHRLIALLILIDQHRRGTSAQKQNLNAFYLEHLEGVNNWDLVDTSAATLVGEHIRENPALIDRLVASPVLWRRRIAIVSTFAELRAGRTALTFDVTKRLLADKHDLIHKATGWLLREAGKVSLPELLRFLHDHYELLPRTALRYAIERLEPADRKRWLLAPQRPPA